MRHSHIVIRRACLTALLVPAAVSAVRAADLPTHRRITEAAFRALGETDPGMVESVVRFNLTTDLARLPTLPRRATSVIYPFVDGTEDMVEELAATAPFSVRRSSGFHFNNLYRYREIEARWTALGDWVDATCEAIRAGNYPLRRRDAELCLLGMVCHCVQDFYYHSNWVGLLNEFTPGDFAPPEFPMWEDLVDDGGSFRERFPGFPRDAALGRLSLSDAFVSRDERLGGLQTGRTRSARDPGGISPWRHRHPSGAQGKVAGELARRTTMRWILRVEERLGHPGQVRSLKACDHSFRRKPGMHQSMHSGSMARAASALPMSAASQPN